jgi:pilus assembly protein Flp/PilA
MKKLLAFMSDESGASAAEYALILALVCAALVVAIGTLTGAISNAMNAAAGEINP